MKYEYGGAYKRQPINKGETVILDNGSMLKVHDIYNPLPNMMHNADVLFIDPPWNLGNLNTFYTKADQIDNHKKEFKNFYKRLFKCISLISPDISYVEVGKQYLAEFIMEMRRVYKYVTFYNSTYYKKNLCYVVRGSHKRGKPKLDGMDEEDIIKWVCANEEYECIGDLCMGQGLVGLNAYRNGKRFVGTELNHKRLSVLLENIVKEGGSYEKSKE